MKADTFQKYLMHFSAGRVDGHAGLGGGGLHREGSGDLLTSMFKSTVCIVILPRLLSRSNRALEKNHTFLLSSYLSSTFYLFFGNLWRAKRTA
jgi:hypothetical protein